MSKTQNSQALRRHHEQRIKNNRKHYHVAQGGSVRHVAKSLKSPANCSCWMCQNPRRVFGEPTFQEMRLGFAGSWGGQNANANRFGHFSARAAAEGWDD